MNKDLLLDGINYISASQASLKTGYASDYIGQLCRDGRVLGRMIGRTWYVDFSSLENYTQNNPKKKKKLLLDSPVRAPINRIDSFLPLLTKSQATSQTQKKPFAVGESRIAEEYIAAKKLPHTGRLSLFNIASTASAAVIMVFTLSGWINFVMPAAGARADRAVADVSSALAQGLAPAPVGEGMVVVPDEADHKGLVERIRENFSDDVNVSFDESNASGVVTPAFSSSTAAGKYAFVLVPIANR